MIIRKEFKVGLLVLSAVLILYFGIDFLKGSDIFNSSNRFLVSYEDVDGLTASNPVILNGFQIGLVRRIRIIQGIAKPVQVELEINKSVVIGESAKALLSNNGLLGGKMIVLDPGNIKKPILTDTLPGETEQGIASMLGEKAQPMVEDLRHLMVGMDSLVKAFKQTPSKLNSTLASFEKLSDAAENMVQGSKDDIGAITHNVDILSQSLLKTEKDLNALLQKFSVLSDSLLKADMAGTVHSLHQTTEHLNKTLASINNGKGTLGKLIQNDSLYRNLNASSASLNALLIDLKANPKRYVHLSVFGSKSK